MRCEFWPGLQRATEEAVEQPQRRGPLPVRQVGYLYPGEEKHLRHGPAQLLNPRAHELAP